MGQMIELTAADGFKNEAYVAYPKGNIRGAVIVIQEIFGVNAHIKAVANGYALAGYLAVAPATFTRAKAGVDLGYTPEDMKAGFELKMAIEGLPGLGVVQDLQAAVTWAHEESKGKVGVVGYCWGGLLTWKSAALVNGLSAAVAYYGGGMTVEPAIELTPKCPTIAHFAQKDHWITPPTIEAFKAKHVNVPVYMYDADHGFNCDMRGAYHEESANLALERTLAFFNTHLS
jgi:carboxymethylenebutenolidase